MSNELDAEIALLAAVVRRSLKDAAKGDDDALSFVRELLPESASTNERMNAFIRAHGRSIATLTTGVPDASPQAPKRANAHAGTGANRAPDIKRHPHDEINEYIRRLSGRGTP